MPHPYLTAILNGDIIVDQPLQMGRVLPAALVLAALIVTALLVRRYTKKK